MTLRFGANRRAFFETTDPEVVENLFDMLAVHPLPGLQAPAGTKHVSTDDEDYNGDEDIVKLDVSEEFPVRAVFAPNQSLFSVNYKVAVTKRRTGYIVGSAPVVEDAHF